MALIITKGSLAHALVWGLSASPGLPRIGTVSAPGVVGILWSPLLCREPCLSVWSQQWDKFRFLDSRRAILPLYPAGQLLPTSVCFYPWSQQPSGSLPFSTLHLFSMFGPWKRCLCSRVGLCLSFSLLILEWGGEWCSKHVLLVPGWLVPSCWILSFLRVRSTFFHLCVPIRKSTVPGL